MMRLNGRAFWLNSVLFYIHLWIVLPTKKPFHDLKYIISILKFFLVVADSATINAFRNVALFSMSSMKHSKHTVTERGTNAPQQG